MKETVSIATGEQLAILDQLFKDNNWSMVVGESIEDCMMCDGLKSIVVINNEEGFVLSVLHDGYPLKRFFTIEDALSDALLTYFIQEYYGEV